jgi:hypothetical protein
MIQVKKQSLYILPANVEILVLRYNEFKQRGRKHQNSKTMKNLTSVILILSFLCCFPCAALANFFALYYLLMVIANNYIFSKMLEVSLWLR